MNSHYLVVPKGGRFSIPHGMLQRRQAPLSVSCSRYHDLLVSSPHVPPPSLPLSLSSSGAVFVVVVVAAVAILVTAPGETTSPPPHALDIHVCYHAKAVDVPAPREANPAFGRHGRLGRTGSLQNRSVSVAAAALHETLSCVAGGTTRWTCHWSKKLGERDRRRDSV